MRRCGIVLVYCSKNPNIVFFIFRKRANVDLGEANEFNERRIYDDQNTSDLLTIAVEVLGTGIYKEAKSTEIMCCQVKSLLFIQMWLSCNFYFVECRRFSQQEL